jgi:hypothetical protein
MAPQDYGYAHEKLSDARRILMAPHAKSEADDFSDAFFECSLVLRDIQDNDLDDNARAWVRTIRQTMNVDGVDDPQEKEKWYVKAKQMNFDELNNFSSALNELVDWFGNRM